MHWFRRDREKTLGNFRFHCYRDFKTYAGKVSAIHEVLELAVREFQNAAEASGNVEKFITDAALRHGLHVRFDECPDIVLRAIQLHIVNVREAFEQFLASLRAEYINICQVDWKDYDKRSSLYVTFQNIFKSQDSAKKRIGALEVDVCNYYRLVRNEVVHADVQSQGLQSEFEQVRGYRAAAAARYQKLGVAPNPPGALTRDDFHLFIRVAQDVAWALCQAARATDEQIGRAIAADVSEFKKRWAGRAERIEKATLAIIEKRFGLDGTEAAKIIGLVL